MTFHAHAERFPGASTSTTTPRWSVERLGSTLLALKEWLDELQKHFGLCDEALNLDLGPLGPLLPHDG